MKGQMTEGTMIDDEVALALVEAGDAAGARREVLRALEIAPRFQRAQELLLRLHEARAGGATR